MEGLNCLPVIPCLDSHSSMWTQFYLELYCSRCFVDLDFLEENQKPVLGRDSSGGDGSIDALTLVHNDHLIRLKIT